MRCEFFICKIVILITMLSLANKAMEVMSVKKAKIAAEISSLTAIAPE